MQAHYPLEKTVVVVTSADRLWRDSFHESYTLLVLSIRCMFVPEAFALNPLQHDMMYDLSEWETISDFVICNMLREFGVVNRKL